MIDWNDRQKLILHLEQCLAKGQFPDPLDDDFEDFLDQSKDATVQFVGDQCKDMSLDSISDGVNKKTWDKAQRLLLLTRSGGEIQTRSRHILHPSQGIACISLLAVIALDVALFLNGFQPVNAIMIGTIPASIVAWALFIWRTHVASYYDEQDPIGVWPFGSTQAIVRALKQTPTFWKRRFPFAKCQSNQISTNAEEHSPSWQTYASLLLVLLVIVVVAPFMLMRQTFPIHHVTHHAGDSEEDWTHTVRAGWDGSPG